MAKQSVTAAIVDAIRVPLTGRRGYRFDGERANHADQAAQTNVSLGLMAAAAQRTDSDSLRQALQTEHTLRQRLAVLEENRRERGLTMEEGWERASIIRGLEEIGTPATLETHGSRRMALFGPVGQARGFLGPMAPWLALVRPWMIWTAALALALGWGGLQSALKERVENQRDEARAALQTAERNLVEAREAAAQLAGTVNEANQDNAETAALLERERHLRRAAEQRARRIERAMEQARAGSPVDYGFGGVRNDSTTEGAAGSDRHNAAGGGSR